MSLPIVAVVGRPNVGKSTFVNRIAQAHEAIVHAAPGVTRDRSYHKADWNGVEFMIIDTGGIEMTTDDAFGESIRKQAIMAAEEADVVLFMVDGSTGVLTGDEDVAKVLKRSRKPVFLLVNKLDTPNNDLAIHDFWSLGLEDPWAISSMHGHGTGDLLDAVVAALPADQNEEEQTGIGVAFIGKPNAGKSSLFNRMAGRERTIVSPVPGTTRDSIDTLVDREGVLYRLVDTAGLRRKSQIDESVEYYSFVRAMRAIDRADVALLMIDASKGITDGDQRVARFAEERGCAIVVLFNKWDLVDEDMRLAIEDDIPRKLGFVSYAPILRISALTGRNVEKLYAAIDTVYAAYTRAVPTSQLNKFLTEIRSIGHTVSKQGATLRVQYGTQTGIKPPRFTFFANHPRLAEDNFQRYLENRMRETFDLTGTPVMLKFRQKG